MTYASTTGEFTFDSPNTPAQGDLFAPVVNPTSLVAQSVVNAADLAVTNVFVPATGTPGVATPIGYEVKNLSTSDTVVSSWVDSVYLSLDNALDPSDVLVQRVTHTGGLAAGLGDLPLFAAAAELEGEACDELRERLRALDVDALTPKQALELLYELKRESSEN